jgi:hypothetical protein
MPLVCPYRPLREVQTRTVSIDLSPVRLYMPTVGRVIAEDQEEDTLTRCVPHDEKEDLPTEAM